MAGMEACNWPVDYSGCAPAGGETTGCEALDSLPPEQIEAFEREAADYLWNWTNRLLGTCEVSVRPCTTECLPMTDTFWGRGPYPWADGHWAGVGWMVPALIGGKWYNLGCGCAGRCNCALDGTRTLALPGPVASVTAVLIDGQQVPEDSYSLVYGRFLSLLLPDQRWPRCQDLNLPSSEPGTFEVIYQKGIPVPAGGQRAAGKLACELAKEACGDNTCELPKRVSTITRQGVTVGFLDQFEGMDTGKTGIRSVDQWITSVNAPRPSSSVRSVDVPLSVGNRAWPRT